MLNDAAPPISAAVPSNVVFFVKIMVSPSGGSPATELTFALKVTICPTNAGFAEAVTMVLVAVRIGSSRLAEVLPILLLSPAYRAVIERIPALGNRNLKVATFPLRGAVAITEPFALNITEPVFGEVNWLPTVAVKVTNCRTTARLGDATRAVAVIARLTICGTRADVVLPKPGVPW